MTKYYNVLEVPNNASQQEIKKAYFAMVRRFSPESDPDKFREIREAYECLMDGGTVQEPHLAETDIYAQQFLKQIKKWNQVQDYKMAAACCEEALNLYPKESVFRYYLVKAQRRAGNTGKAVKNCEILVRQEPDQILYLRELAISYMERGYTKKAYGAFEKAYELGCREEEFTLSFSLTCKSCGLWERGREILLEMVGDGKKCGRNDLAVYIDAYAGISYFNIRCQEDKTAQIMASVLKFLECNSAYLEENSEDILYLFDGLMENEFPIEKVEGLLDCVGRIFRLEENKAELQGFRKTMHFYRLTKDERLSETLVETVGVLNEFEIRHNEEREVLRFFQLDAKLCIIAEMPEILSEIDIIQAEYPLLYETIRELVEEVKLSTSLQYLKEKYLKEYRRKAEYFSEARYFELYPEEKESEGRKVCDADNTYVRSSVKVGRNDPCPCGSGKKYKKCCGR